MVGDSHIEFVVTVIHLVNETAEHGRRKEHLTRQVNMGSNDRELRVHQVTATKERDSIECPSSHAAKTAKRLIEGYGDTIQGGLHRYPAWQLNNENSAK